MEPTFDKDGYPTEATLRRIRTWDVKTFADRRALIDYVGKAWHFREWGWAPAVRRRREYKNGLLCRKYSISTGGWSGNESLIGELEKNWMFWSLCWVSNRRGGHYEFSIPEEDE